MAPQACPTGCGLSDSIESAAGFPFCVYYDSADTTLSQAQNVRDYTDDYWDVYKNDYGWAMPTEFNGGKFKVCLVENAIDPTDCNGGVSSPSDSMKVYEGCDSTVEMMMLTVGHELAHAGPQLGPNNLTNPNIDALWAHEGMARSSEDKVFDVIDNNPGAMAQPFSYNKEVDQFFVNPNHDLTDYNWRYESAIWWTYYAEQCGSDPVGEPGLGVKDSFKEFWHEAITSDNIAALNLALTTLGCPQFDVMVPKFVLANYTKDLTGLPDASYYYIDEKNPGNPDTYGPLAPYNNGTIASGTAVTWNNRAIERYGAEYYVAAPNSANCPVITAKFHADSGSPFYHIVTSKSGAFSTHVQGSGTDWVQSFLNDGITTIAAIAGSLGSSSQVDVELSCSAPTLDIKQPNQMAPEYVGGHADGDKFLVQVLVSTTVGGPVVGGLTVNDFAVRVGAHNATIVGGGQVEHQYFLQVIAPDPGTNGPYDLHVDLEKSGTSTVIASDTENEAIVYDATNEDNIYVIDRSGSMGWYYPTPWSALVDAFKLAVDTTNSSEGIAVVAFESDVNPAPFGMQFATLPVRTAAKTYIDGIEPGTSTSIGDGMSAGAAQRTGSPTGNTKCRYVLLSDGQENTPAYWADVAAAVQATGCPVMAIAFGPGANETLMQQIASDTGGAYYYNDLYAGSPPVHAAPASSFADTLLDLGSTYQYAQVYGERQRLLTEKGQASYQQMYSHTVQIDASVLTADFVLNWPSTSYATMNMYLVQPNGTIISGTYSFEDYDVGHVGRRIDNPMPGRWQILVRLVSAEITPVPYQVMVTAKTNVSARLILPTILRQFMTGNRIPIYALVTSGVGPLSGASVWAAVTAPSGMTQTVPLQHTSGGLYLGYYTLGTQANQVSPPSEYGSTDPAPNDEGSYRIDLLVNGQDGLHRETQGAFSILEATDANSNGLPDTWEREHGVTDPSGDPDLDLLNNSDEYYSGTDPNNSDSDGGGENDGSEVAHGLNPLDPADDQIAAPDFFHAAPVTGGDVALTYDVKSEYVKMSLYRASSPWTLLVPELPLTGLYTDTTPVLGNSYAYRLVATDGDTHRSRVLDGEQITATLDPIPPEAEVIVNSGALTTTNLSVVLSFDSRGDQWGSEAFSDIAEMKISNNPSMAGAGWQAFAQDVPWTLDASSHGLTQVYVLFKDTSGNESVGPAIGSIYITSLLKIYLPLILRNAP